MVLDKILSVCVGMFIVSQAFLWSSLRGGTVRETCPINAPWRTAISRAVPSLTGQRLGLAHLPFHWVNHQGGCVPSRLGRVKETLKAQNPEMGGSQHLLTRCQGCQVSGEFKNLEKGGGILSVSLLRGAARQGACPWRLRKEPEVQVV